MHQIYKNIKGLHIRENTYDGCGKTPETIWNNFNPIPFENEKRLNYL